MNKFVIAAFAALIALPVAAQEPSPGKVALARSLGLDPNAYTLSELTAINGEFTPTERADRIGYINKQHARGKSGTSHIQSTTRQQSRFLSQRQGVGRNDY